MSSYGLLNMDTPVLANQKTSIPQLCVETGCHLEELPRAMIDIDRFEE